MILCSILASPGNINNRIPHVGLRPYVLNTRSEECNTVFCSCLAYLANILCSSMFICMSYTGLTRRDTLFVFLRLRHRNTFSFFVSVNTYSTHGIAIRYAAVCLEFNHP